MVATITTVGYGDISGNNMLERIICILLMVMGVIFFSISSGNLTSIISKDDDINKIKQQRKIILNRIYSQYQIPSALYVDLLNAIETEMVADDQELSGFIDELPHDLKQKLNKCIYSVNYEVIRFLQYKPDNFINWLCPLLQLSQVD